MLLEIQNRTEMIYLVDQDKMRRKTLTQIHSDNPCSTAGYEGTGKDLRFKQPFRRIDAEASTNRNLLQKQHRQKEFRNTKKEKTVCASIVHCKIKKKYLKINVIAYYSRCFSRSEFFKLILNLLKFGSLMFMGKAFQILAPWYLTDFWHREKENLGIYRFFLVVERVRRLWIEEIGEKNEEIQGGKACLERWHIIFPTTNVY